METTRAVKIFIKNGCHRCSAAKVLGNGLENLGFYIQYFDLETVDGLAEAAMNQVMTTPTIIVEDESENIIQCWRGTVPNEHEVIDVLGAFFLPSQNSDALEIQEDPALSEFAEHREKTLESEKMLSHEGTWS